MATKKNGGDLTAVIDFVFDNKKLKEFEKRFDKVVKGAKKFEKVGKRAMDVVNQSTKKATRETDQYKRELSSVNRELLRMGKLGAVAKKAMGIGIVGAGAAGFIAKRAIDKELEFAQVARQVKTTTGLMRALDIASTKTGLTFSQMSDMIKEISISTGDALTSWKTGAASEAFKMLGYTKEQVQALSEQKDQGKAFLSIIKDIQKSGKSISDQSWIADGIFKGEGDALIGGLQEYKDFGGEMERTMSLFADTTEATENLTEAITDLKTLLGVLTTGLLKENSDLFLMFADSLKEVSQNVKQEDITKFMTEVRDVASDLIPTLDHLITNWGRYLVAITAFKSVVMVGRLIAFKTEMQAIKNLTTALATNTALVNANTAAKMRNAQVGLGGGLNTLQKGSKLAAGGKIAAVVALGLAAGKGITKIKDKIDGGDSSSRFNDGIRYLGELSTDLFRVKSAKEMGIKSSAEIRAQLNAKERLIARESAQTNNNYATNTSNVQIHVDGIDSDSIDKYAQGGF